MYSSLYSQAHAQPASNPYPDEPRIEYIEPMSIGQRLVLWIALLGLVVQSAVVTGAFWLTLIGDRLHSTASDSSWSLVIGHLAIAGPAFLLGCIAAANTGDEWRKRLLIANALFVIPHIYVMLQAMI
jgi:hypothetical protein